MSNQLENLISKKEEIQKKIERENSILKKSKYLESTKERKERTRKLIQKGALLDKYFDIENLSIKWLGFPPYLHVKYFNMCAP